MFLINRLIYTNHKQSHDNDNDNKDSLGIGDMLASYHGKGADWLFFSSAIAVIFI